jgi:serine/threonine protein kinase
MNYCLSCGTKLPTHARFCPQCGQKIILEEPPNIAVSPQLNILDTAPEISQILEATMEHPEEDMLPLEASLHSTSIESVQPSGEIEQGEQNRLQAANVSYGLVARRYRLVKQVGNGNMSEVYQAEDTRHKNKIVAVKLLNTRHKDAIKQEMYLRETRALEQLEHPNIIKHFDYGWSDERSCHYIVLEYVPQTLVDMITKHRDCEDRSWCWPLMRDMADALVHAHSKGIIHRDLKSTNILITEQSTAKLTDFGISLLRFEIRTGITLSGYWSEGYAAPEQRSMQQTTNRSDIYSLGCVFYHMLSGQEPPSSGLTPGDVQALKLQPMIERMLQMMLEGDAQNRFESAERLARFLENTKKLQTYPDLFLRVTRKAHENLFDASLIRNSTLEDACQFLNTEFVQDGFPKEVQIKLENNSVHIFTDTMKLICIKDDKLPLLTVAAVHTYVYAPQHEDQRNHVPFYRYRWQFLKYSHELPGEKQAQAQTILEEGLHKLSQRKQEEKEYRRQKSERKDFTKIWNKVLDLQQQLLDESPKLEYVNWRKEGNTITFQLKNAASDDLEWPESAPIGFLSSGTRMESAGLLMGYSGASVQVSATQGGTQEGMGSSKKIPPSGTIGLFQIQTSAAMEKQRRALEMLISGGTLNPGLPDVLLDLST